MAPLQDPISRLLPNDAREILRRAVTAEYANEFERMKALEAAIQRVKQMCPKHFNQE